MVKFLSPLLWVLVIVFSACTPQTAPTTPPAATAAAQPAEVKTLAAPAPTETQPSPSVKTYRNEAFGLSFQFPAAWFGPDEYISGDTLRLAIGSDKVYPYGEPPEEPSGVKNSYGIVIQYTKNNQNLFYQGALMAVAGLKDGESTASERSMLIRVRELSLGRFKGYEYISTLSESASTEPVYSREIVLVSEQGDLLTISGSPNNVEVASGAGWREAYRALDSANLGVYQQVADSLTVR